MNIKRLSLFTAVITLLFTANLAFAKRVNHDVTPTNIDKLPFSASVKVKDVGKFKEFEITIKGAMGNLFHPSSAGGAVVIAGDGKPDETMGATKTVKDGTIIFTFRLSLEQLERARFTFVEDEEDWKRPFPTNGNYYQFILKDFVGKTKK